MISDLIDVLTKIKTLLDPHFTSVFTETKTKISPDEFPAVIMTISEGEIQMQSENQSLITVSLQIDVLDRGLDIQESLITHANKVVEALNPFVQIDDSNAKAYPQNFSFSFDDEDSRTGSASITYNISL